MESELCRAQHERPPARDPSHGYVRRPTRPPRKRRLKDPNEAVEPREKPLSGERTRPLDTHVVRAQLRRVDGTERQHVLHVQLVARPRVRQRHVEARLLATSNRGGRADW